MNPFSHPEDFFVETRLRDGTRVSVCVARTSDADKLSEYFRGLGDASVEERFFGMKVKFSAPNELRQILDVSSQGFFGLLATIGSGPDSRIAGEAFWTRDDLDPRCAEIGISVADDMRRSGLGTLLLGYLIVWARHAGFRRLEADVMAANQDALWFLASRGFRVPTSANFGLCRVAMLIPREAPMWRPVEWVRQRAYQLYLERGAKPGRELDDWLTAEREILSE